MVKHSERRSTGDMISTICFAGVSAKLAFEALAWTGGALGLTGLWLSALACLLGALRFRLQAFFNARRR